MVKLVGLADECPIVIAEPFRSRYGGIADVLRRRSPTARPQQTGGPLSFFSPTRQARRDSSDIQHAEVQYRRYDKLLAEHVARQGLDGADVVVTHPIAAGMLKLAWARRVTYYATDDWTVAPEHERLWPVLSASADKIRAQRRNVVAVSQTILDALRPTGETLVLPNGVDVAEWKDFSESPLWMERLPRPIAVYVATIDSRLDIDAVHAIAQAIEPGTVLLIGKVITDGIVEAFASQENVVFAGPLPRVEVPAVLRAANIALLPHRVSPFTAAMSPLKVFEALAAGKPVVATDLPPVRDIHSYVLLVTPNDDYGMAARRALDIGDMNDDQRLAFLTTHAWSDRHRELLEFIRREG